MRVEKFSISLLEEYMIRYCIQFVVVVLMLTSVREYRLMRVTPFFFNVDFSMSIVSRDSRHFFFFLILTSVRQYLLMRFMPFTKKKILTSVREYLLMRFTPFYIYFYVDFSKRVSSQEVQAKLTLRANVQ